MKTKLLAVAVILVVSVNTTNARANDLANLLGIANHFINGPQNSTSFVQPGQYTNGYPSQPPNRFGGYLSGQGSWPQTWGTPLGPFPRIQTQPPSVPRMATIDGIRCLDLLSDTLLNGRRNDNVTLHVYVDGQPVDALNFTFVSDLSQKPVGRQYRYTHSFEVKVLVDGNSLPGNLVVRNNARGTTTESFSTRNALMETEYEVQVTTY